MTIHFQVNSSAVACGAKMRYVDTAHDDPKGWDLGNSTVNPARVTCPECRKAPRK